MQPLEPYRRHVANCPHRAKGVAYTRCSCPIWVYGELEGSMIRQSLKTRDWRRAVDRIAELEKHPEVVEKPKRTLRSSVDLFLSECKARNVRASTLRSYKKLLDLLLAELGDDHLIEVMPEELSRFRANRVAPPRRKGSKEHAITSNTSRKELEILRSFFNFCVRQKWISDSPAAALRPPVGALQPAEPFSQAEIERILAACSQVGGKDPRAAEWSNRANALVLIMLYTGLRVSDVAKLEWGSIDMQTGRLRLWTLKTGADVSVRLERPALDALGRLPQNGDRVFWATGLLHTICNEIRVTLNRVGLKAKLHCHPHRFRDTFASRLLQNGKDIRTVQHLLGHSSVRTTERHYAHFVASHQARLDDATASLDFVKEPTRVLVMPRGKHRYGNS